MTATVADRPCPPAARADVRHGRVAVVLVGVLLGLLAGAVACAAGLASAGGHHVVAAPAGAVDVGGQRHEGVAGDRHADHTPAERGDTDPASTATAGSVGHPGMACVVAFDLLVPAPSATRSASPHLRSAAAMLTEVAVDVEPPVPRPS